MRKYSRFVECFVNAKLSKRFLMKKGKKLFSRSAVNMHPVKHFTAVIEISNRNKL